MTRFQRIVVVRLLIVAAIALSGCLAVVRIDLTGTWTGSLQWTTGPFPGITSPISLDLVHENRDLSGTVTLMGPASQSFELAITSGRTSARSMRLDATGTLDLISPPVSVEIELDGSFDASTMSGTGAQTNDGTTYEFTWEVVRTSGPPDA